MEVKSIRNASFNAAFTASASAARAEGVCSRDDEP